jgi:hypothetical protein
MSSVQGFLRQRVIGARALLVDLTNLYVMVPTAGNYVGNYPPAVMVSLATAGASVLGLPGATTAYARDMGKTVVAGVATSTAGTTVGTVGAFRQVQLLKPVTVQYPTSVTNLGVLGQPAGTWSVGDSGYNTFFIPEVLGGVLASTAVVGGGTAVTQNSATLIPDGQL